MNQILSTLSGYTDNFLGALAVVSALLILYKIKSIVEFFDSRKRNRVKQLQDALKCDSISTSPITKEFLQSRLEIEQVKQSTGLRMEKEFREELFKAHSTTKGEIPFSIFKKALSYINYNDSKIVIDISEKHAKQDKTTIKISYGSIVMGCFFLTPLIINPNSPDIIMTTLAGIAYLFLGVYFLTIHREPYASAVKTESALIKHGYIKSKKH